MREEIKVQLLQNILDMVTQKYDSFTSKQEELIKKNFEKAIKDPLTGLYNREYLKEIGKKILEEARRENIIVYLAFIDVNNFKQVNDKYGHDKGDEVLKGIAEELKRSFRSYDIIVRYGGDEFIVLVKLSKEKFSLDNILHLQKKVDLEKILNKINERIKEKFAQYGISLSYGIATNMETFDLDKLIEIADARMYEDKKKKKMNR